MITSALIAQCRRDFGDVPKLTRMARLGDGSINMFNTARFPIIEGSISVLRGTSATTSGTAPGQYQLNLDSGDLQMNTTPASGLQVTAQFKYANWRDANWMEAIGDAVEALNGRGFFRQVVRLPRTISAGVRTFSAPSACIDLYELLEVPATNVYNGFRYNWSYQSDGNKVVLGGAPATQLSGAVSYLRRMQSPSATSMALDVKDDWIPLIKKFAGQKYMSHMATKIATRGNATIEEGHFSFSNARRQADSLLNEFGIEAARAKPTRPAKDIGFNQEGGGLAG